MTPSQFIYYVAILGTFIAFLLSRYFGDYSILTSFQPAAITTTTAIQSISAMSSGMKSVAYFVNWVS
jgi:hypothetical protein